MPRLDGIEATRRIIENSPTAVIMLTAYSDRELVQRALAAGASGYLVKPVVEGQLQSAITVARARFWELQQEREVAYSLAKSFIGEPPPLPGFQVAWRYEPAFEAARVGGDFFDFIELGSDRCGIVLGDVCGKGLRRPRIRRWPGTCCVLTVWKMQLPREYQPAQSRPLPAIG